ncbi:MAG TPA: hypothetical protein VIO11_04215 [Candidatus Methanoperedens sp.]
MVISRHISLDNDCLKKIEPYVEKHKGNFSAAIREIIELSGKKGTHADEIIVDNSLFKWMLKEIDGKLIPDNVLDELIDPMLINSMEKLKEELNKKFNELEWGIDLNLKYDNDRDPSFITVQLGGVYQKTKFAACVLSQYLVRNSLEREPLEIRSVVDLNDTIKIELQRSNKKAAIESLNAFFGGMDDLSKAIKSRPDFWKAVIKRHHLSNYNMITIHRNYFEDMLAGKVPMGEITIETLAKRPIQEIPLKEMLSLVKEVYETSRVADRVDIEKETIILFHSYRDEDVIGKLKKSIVMLLEANGHLYDVKSTANMIVLTHRPDVGLKINEVVDSLKTSSSPVDQEVVMFMTFLKGLKDIPDMSVSMSALGRRMGKSLMQEFEKEHEIKNWDIVTLKSAFEIIHSKLQIESEWRVDRNNLLYTVRKCNLFEKGGTFDKYICHIIQETFRGALGCVFGNKVELEVRRSLAGGDIFCEVVIHLP